MNFMGRRIVLLVRDTSHPCLFGEMCIEFELIWYRNKNLQFKVKEKYKTS